MGAISKWSVINHNNYSDANGPSGLIGVSLLHATAQGPIDNRVFVRETYKAYSLIHGLKYLEGK